MPKPFLVSNEERHTSEEPLDLSDLSRFSTPTNVEEDQGLHVPPQQPGRAGSFFTSVGVRVVIGLLIAGGWWLFTSFDDANRDASGEIVEGGDLGVMTMQVGDCFDDPDSNLVYDVQAIPCSQPHDNEVFALGDVSGVFPNTHPGPGALDDYAYEQCIGSNFRSYVGVAYADSILGVFTLTPTEESWDDGDRGYICALYRLDLAKLSDTARASGI